MVLVIFVSSAVGCTGPENHALDGDILVIGDSFLDYHTPDADIASVAGRVLDWTWICLRLAGPPCSMSIASQTPMLSEGTSW